LPFLHCTGGGMLNEAEDARDYSGVGRDIRLVREASGQALQDVSRSLRISPHHLEAIEAGRHDELPSPVYVLGFVRSYAAYLQLDPDEMVRRARLELEPALSAELRQMPVAIQSQPRPSRGLLALALVLALGVFGFWYLDLDNQAAQNSVAALPPVVQQTEADPPSVPNPLPAVSDETAVMAPEAPMIPSVEELVGQNPPPIQPPSDEDTEAAATLNAPETGANPEQPQAILAEEVGEVEITPGAALTPESLGENYSAAIPPLNAQTAPPPQVPAPVAVEAPVTAPVLTAPVVLRASADTWLRISRANGEILKSWVMRTGEEYIPPSGETGLKVMIGNAGALIIYLEGTAMPPLGAKGAVIRDLPLDADALRAKFSG